MRPAPVPATVRRQLRRAVQGAIQPSNVAPTSGTVGRFRMGRAAPGTLREQRRHLESYQEWQDQARRAGRVSGPARFAASMVAQTASRVTLRVEERTAKGNWVETENEQLIGLMDGYSNERLGQGPAELIRLHTWHYGVAGEACIVNVDDQYGNAEWLVVAMPAIDWDQPELDLATIKLHPAGNLVDGMSFVARRDEIFHYWMPDEEWLALAVSPMTAAMDDLARYESLSRLAKNQANSPLAMSKLLWTPSAAHQSENDPADDGNDPNGEAESPLLKEYRRWARTAYSDLDDESLESLLPLMIWYDGPKPEPVDLSTKLDEKGIEYRQEALSDFARDVDVPASLIVGGGSEDVNHWNAWMTKERFAGTVAPILNRVTHQDLTTAYLHPLLRLEGVQRVGAYRVGYDETDVVKKPDQGDMAIKAWLAGLLGRVPALEACGFDRDLVAQDDDLEVLAAVLSNFAGEIPTAEGIPEPTSGLPSGPGNVNELAPPGALAAYLPPALRPRARERIVVRPPEPRPLAAAALDPTGRGCMVALDVPDETAAAIAVPGGEPADALHVTLAHLTSEVREAQPELRPVIEQAAQGAAAMGPPTVELTHVERFVAGNDEGLEPVVLVDHHPEVYALRDRLAELLDAAGVPYSDDHGFRCHVTLGYWPSGEGPQAGALEQPVTFVPEGISVHWGDDVETFSFRAPSVDPQPVIEAASREISPVERAARDAQRELRKANRVLAQVGRIRRDSGRQILAAAEIALAEAVKLAGSRAKGKAQKRTPSMKQSVAAAVDSGSGLGPFRAALGLQESQLLFGAFSTFEPRAAGYLATARAEERAALEEAGYDPGPDDPTAVEAAAGFLAAALLALARQRIMRGTDTATLGGPGEVSGDVPAQIVAQAVAVADGRLTATLPENPDDLPAVHAAQRERAEQGVARALRARLDDALLVDVAGLPRRQQARLERLRADLDTKPLTEYVWVHGFWASPKDVFPPHRNRNGFRTTAPENDPALANPGPWPDPGTHPYYQPGDHLGCSCEQVAQVDPATIEAVGALA